MGLHRGDLCSSLVALLLFAGAAATSHPSDVFCRPHLLSLLAEDLGLSIDHRGPGGYGRAMRSRRARWFVGAAGAFFAVSAYWFIAFLNASDEPGGSSDGWMLVFACAFFTIGCSLVAQSNRRRGTR